MNPMNALPPPQSPPSARPVRPVENEINFFDYVGVLMRRWKIVVLALCVVFAIVAFNTFRMKPIYEAISTIRIMDNQNSLSQMNQSNWVDPINKINTEIATIKSRSIAEKVVERLHLNWQVSEKSKEFSFKILDFTSAAKNPIYHIKMISADTFEVKDSSGQVVGQGQAGALMSKEGFRLLINDIQGKIGDTCQLTLVLLQEAALQVQGGFDATVYGKQSDIIRASYRSPDPLLARDLVNAFVAEYIGNSVDLKSEQTKKTLLFIENQLKALRGELDASEDKLKSYKSTAGMLDLGNKASNLIEKISDMEKRLTELEVKKTELLALYTPTHRAVKSVQQQIGAVQKKISAYQNDIKKLPAIEQNLASLTRVSKVNADNYTFLLQKREEARIAKGSTVSNLNIIDSAVTPTWPIKPNIQHNLFMGLLGGLAIGLALAFLLEYLDDTIKDADQAKRATGLGMLATIPKIAIRESRQNGLPHPATPPRITGRDPDRKDVVPSNNVLIANYEPKSSVAEAFRGLRTSLHFSAFNKDKKIMLFTSTFPGEGKSVISSNTAVVIAQTGARVLIVDCDLRRSSLHEKFHCRKTPGLSEVLTRDVTLEQAINKTAMPGLDLLCAGTTPPNPSELLGSEEMRRFLESQREKYDFIVIDAPPVLVVTDAPVLTTVSDLVILVMEAGRVPIKAAQHVREILARLNAPIAGIVINDKTGKGERYSYYNTAYYGKTYGYKRGYLFGDGYGYYSDENPQQNRKGYRWDNFIPDKLLRNLKKYLPRK